MTSETPFSFDYAFSGKKHWRGGPDKLVSFQNELIQYKTGLETLSRILSMGSFSKWIIIGYSAANMVADMLRVSSNIYPHLQVNIFGRDGWNLCFNQKKSIEIYRYLSSPFDNGVIVEDFSNTAKKALELNRILIQPLTIPITFAFLTATDEAVSEMKRVGIDPIVAINHPTRKLMELLDLRKSPGSGAVS